MTNFVENILKKTKHKNMIWRREEIDLYKFRFGHQEHAQYSFDIRALQLVQKVVEAGHSLLPVVQLSPRAKVISLLSQLLTLS